jgi:NADPH:quinone reductase-like Zn-dependent oxidoreductase
VLLNGAGGGVGTFALQVAKKLYDAEVSVVDRADKLDTLSALGADHVIDYRKEDFTRHGKSYDLIVDVKTNRSPFAYARALNPKGTYAGTLASLERRAIPPPKVRSCFVGRLQELEKGLVACR